MTAAAVMVVPVRASDAVRNSDLVRTGYILRAVPRSSWRNPAKGIHRQEREYSASDPAVQARAARLMKKERDYEDRSRPFRGDGPMESVDDGGWMEGER